MSDRAHCVFDDQDCSASAGRRIVGKNLCEHHTDRLFDDRPDVLSDWFPE